MKFTTRTPSYGDQCGNRTRLFALRVDGFQSEISRFFTQLDRRQLRALLLVHALQHFQLDREAVAVPPGDEPDAFPFQSLVPAHEVFQNFVERVSDV